jgi:hypothetical protein
MFLQVRMQTCEINKKSMHETHAHTHTRTPDILELPMRYFIREHATFWMRTDILFVLVLAVQGLIVHALAGNTLAAKALVHTF